MAKLKEGEVCSIVLRNVWATINCLNPLHATLADELKAKLLALVNKRMSVTYCSDQGFVVVKTTFDTSNFSAIFDDITQFVKDCYAEHGLGTVTTNVLSVPISRIMKIEDGVLCFPNSKEKSRYGEAYDELYDYLQVNRPPSNFDRRHFYRSVFDMYKLWNFDVDKTTTISIGTVVTHKRTQENGDVVLSKEDLGITTYNTISVRMALCKIMTLLNASWLLGHMDDIANFVFALDVKGCRKVWHHVFSLGDETNRKLWASRAVCELNGY